LKSKEFSFLAGAGKDSILDLLLKGNKGQEGVASDYAIWVDPSQMIGEQSHNARVRID
jgi:hypothetical protein